MMTPDLDAALAALRLYTLGPFEVRALSPDGATIGLFREIDAAAGPLGELLLREDLSGVYVTPNPLTDDPRMDALPTFGRFVAGARGAGDADVERTAWLLLDVDPVRPSGVSSTDLEKARAGEVRAACCETTAAAGWPQPVWADSGNGYHAMWRVGAGVTAAHVRAALGELARRHDTPGARVDKAVWNPARIWKLPGSVARKGESTEERPHRLAVLEFVPEVLEEVTLEQLEAFAPLPVAAPAEPPRERTGEAAVRFADAHAAYLRDRGREYPQGKPGHCPGCGHNGCCKAVPGAPERWICYSSNHPDGCGRRGPSGAMTGDALDIDAHAAGRTPTEHLRAEGYMPAWDERSDRQGLEATEAMLRGLRAATLAEAGEVASERPPVVLDGEEARSGHWEHDLTGIGNAHRFAALCGADVRYVPGLGWRVWDGTRWVVDADGVAVLAKARAVVADIRREAAVAVELKEASKATKWADQTASASGMQSLVTVARSLQSLWADASIFDRHPHLLNTPAGTVDLRSGVMREHRREDYLTQRTAVAPDFTLEPYRFLRFLETSMPHVEDRIFLQRFAGYCAVGEVSEHVFVVNWGPSGRNGKSTFWEAVGSALGQDYAGAAPREMLLLPPRGATKSPSDLVVLVGKRLLWASEPGSGRVVDGELVKMLSGGDRVVVKRLYREPEEVRPQAKVTFLANDLRVLQTMDAAAWARAQILEWPVSFYGREDPRLHKDLRDEAPGILAYIIRWAVDYHAHGIPPARQDAKVAARRFQTPIEAFIAECCEVNEAYRVDAGTLYTAFQRFVNDLGIAEADGVPTTPIAFGKLVGSRFRSEASNGIRYRVGVRLKTETAKDFFQ